MSAATIGQADGQDENMSLNKKMSSYDEDSTTDLSQNDKTKHLTSSGTPSALLLQNDNNSSVDNDTQTVKQEDIEDQTMSVVELNTKAVMEDPKILILMLAPKTYLYQIGMVIHVYAFPVILVVGLVGNTLSLLVMLQKHNRHLSCCVYMAALAVSDNVVMLSGLWIWAVVAFNTGFASWNCQIYTFMYNGASICGTILLLAMNFDRFLAIRFPLKAPAWNTPARARKVVAAIVTTGLAFNCIHFYTTTLQGKWSCVSFSREGLFSRVYALLSACVSFVIPFIILLTSNILILVTIRRRHDFLDHNNGKPGSSTQTDASHTSLPSKMEQQRLAAAKRVDKQLTKMLILISFAFIILVLPQYIRYFLDAFFINMYSDLEIYVKFFFLSSFTSKLYSTNSAINFFLYVVSGAKFRRDLCFLFKCYQYSSKAQESKLSFSRTSQVKTSEIPSGSHTDSPM